jgi:hypothetical protein
VSSEVEMTKKHERGQFTRSLQDRLKLFTTNTRAAARRLPRGAERADLMQKAREGEAAANIERWLSSPGLQKPK